MAPFPHSLPTLRRMGCTCNHLRCCVLRRHTETNFHHDIGHADTHHSATIATEAVLSQQFAAHQAALLPSYHSTKFSTLLSHQTEDRSLLKRVGGARITPCFGGFQAGQIRHIMSHGGEGKLCRWGRICRTRLLVAQRRNAAGTSRVHRSIYTYGMPSGSIIRRRSVQHG